MQRVILMGLGFALATLMASVGLALMAEGRESRRGFLGAALVLNAGGVIWEVCGTPRRARERQARVDLERELRETRRSLVEALGRRS